MRYRLFRMLFLASKPMGLIILRKRCHVFFPSVPGEPVAGVPTRNACNCTQGLLIYTFP
jgi:hypothetical protein